MSPLQIMHKARNNFILILAVDLLVQDFILMIPFSLVVVGILLVAEDGLGEVAGSLVVVETRTLVGTQLIIGILPILEVTRWFVSCVTK